VNQQASASSLLLAARTLPDPLAGSTRDFLFLPGRNLTAKAAAFAGWQAARVAHGGFPYAKRLVRAPAPRASLRLLDGTVREGINFSSQDYLGLSAHPEIKAAAQAAIEHFGPHSAGSAALAGEMEMADALEHAIGEHLRTPFVTLYPTGWAAGYGVIRGLVRDTDHVVLDALGHNCLQEGANASTRNVHLFRHLDLDHAREKLAAIRARDAQAGVLLVTESLFSMDADTPDLAAFQALAREFDALFVVDAAHDYGCLGPDGTGRIGEQGLLGQVDVVMGSFSKTFASNGGFVASHREEIREYFRYFSPSNTFSNALGPAQLASVLAALRLVRNPEGDRRRAGLLAAVETLRGGLLARGCEVFGAPSPIVPAMIGDEAIARVAAKLCSERGVLTNLVEFPAVARNTARFRMQVMATHEIDDCRQAAHIVADAIADARTIVGGDSIAATRVA
jgi:7-keto-8-aminopelargonate synthetase-like enzyme